MSELQNMVWEDLVTLNSRTEPVFTVLGPAASHYEADTRKDTWSKLEFKAALARDGHPLPETRDREGYWGPNHFSYWASGLQDSRNVWEAAEKYGTKLGNFLDIGCASGRVIRHFAVQKPDCRTLGCDINRLHVEWCNTHLPSNCTVFQNHSIPSLPIESNSIDVVSAFSVFTHIEALESAWLMEIQRILRPGGLAWITVHTEDTLKAMNPDWPLWKPVMNHPDAHSLISEDRNFSGNRMVMRWKANRSYSSNVFYKKAYLHSHW